MGVTTSDLGNAKRLKYIPWCSAVLTAVNILVFVCCHIRGDILYPKGVFSVAYLLHGKEYYRLITSMFLHANVGHLVNNMILLYFGGEMVEKTIGKVRFLVLYFLAGICGNLLSAVCEAVTGGYYDSLGASGAVFGIIGGLLYLVLARKGRAAHISMQRMFLMIALSLYAGFRDTGINGAAHLGGLLGGCIITFVLCHIGSIPMERLRNR